MANVIPIKANYTSGAATSLGEVTAADTVAIPGTLSVGPIASPQATFSGYSAHGGANVVNGQVLIGGVSASQGTIQYDAVTGSVGNLYIDNTQANTGAGITMRVQTTGTPINALSIGGDGTVTIPGSLTVGSLNSGSLAGFRNRVINGGFAIDQRNNGSAVTTGTTFPCDRWLLYLAACTSVQRVAGDVNSRNAIRFTKASGSANGITCVATALETIDSIPLAGKQVTLSFRSRKGSSYTGTSFWVVLCTGTGTDQGIWIGPISSSWTGQINQTPTASSASVISTSFQTYSYTYTVPSNTTQIGLSLGRSDSTATGSTNDYLEITDVQLEPGTVATPPEARPIGVELALCQRYYETSYSVGVTPGSASTLGAKSGIASSTSVAAGCSFTVQKRAIPNSITIYSPGGTAATVWDSTDTNRGTVSATNIGSGGYRYINNSGAAWTAGTAISYHYAIDAEL